MSIGHEAAPTGRDVVSAAALIIMLTALRLAAR
jgi:hypothetical protein